MDKKTTRADAVALYTAIMDIKGSGFERETLMKYIKLRQKLREIYNEFENVRQDISEQTKPKKWKEGDDTKDWEAKFKPILNDYLKEEIDLDTKILTENEAVDLVMANDMPGSVMDIIIERLSE